MDSTATQTHSPANQTAQSHQGDKLSFWAQVGIFVFFPAILIVAIPVLAFMYFGLFTGIKGGTLGAIVGLVISSVLFGCWCLTAFMLLFKKPAVALASLLIVFGGFGSIGGTMWMDYREAESQKAGERIARNNLYEELRAKRKALWAEGSKIQKEILSLRDARRKGRPNPAREKQLDAEQTRNFAQLEEIEQTIVDNGLQNYGFQ